MELSNQGHRTLNITGVSFLIFLVSMVALLIITIIFKDINAWIVLAIISTSAMISASAYITFYARTEKGLFSYYAYFSSLLIFILALTNIYVLLTGNFVPNASASRKVQKIECPKDCACCKECRPFSIYPNNFPKI